MPYNKFHSINKDRYLKMLYARATHIRVPFFASTGNDGWALAWFDQSETSKFVCDGWTVMQPDIGSDLFR